MLRSIGKGKFTPYAALRHALCCVIFATTHRTMPQYSGYYGHVAYVNTKRTTTRDVARHRQFATQRTATGTNEPRLQEVMQNVIMQEK